MRGTPPQAIIETIPKPVITEMVSSLRELHDMGMCRTDEEVRDRIEAYFKFCEEHSFRPGIESLCMSLHITRMTLMRWARGEGCSQERQEIAQSAKQFCVAYIENASLSGRLNPASSIFMLKNWANYRDVTTIEEIPRPERLSPSMSPEEIAEQIEKDIPLDIDQAETEAEIINP